MSTHSSPSPRRTKVIVTTTLPPVLTAELQEVSADTGIPKNLLIEQGLRLLFSQHKKNATPVEEVALSDR